MVVLTLLYRCETLTEGEGDCLRFLNFAIAEPEVTAQKVSKTAKRRGLGL